MTTVGMTTGVLTAVSSMLLLLLFPPDTPDDPDVDDGGCCCVARTISRSDSPSGRSSCTKDSMRCCKRFSVSLGSFGCILDLSAWVRPRWVSILIYILLFTANIYKRGLDGVGCDLDIYCRDKIHRLYKYNECLLYVVSVGEIEEGKS